MERERERERETTKVGRTEGSSSKKLKTSAGVWFAGLGLGFRPDGCRESLVSVCLHVCRALLGHVRWSVALGRGFPACLVVYATREVTGTAEVDRSSAKKLALWGHDGNMRTCV